MAEYTNVVLQTVPTGGNVAFSETPVRSNGCVQHREGSGLFTMSGASRGQCRARYKVSFGGNIAVPAGGTAGPISLAIAIEGEPLGSATMIETPAAVGEFANVFAAVFIEVPSRCCLTVGVRNTSAAAVDVQNANLIIERVA